MKIKFPEWKPSKPDPVFIRQLLNNKIEMTLTERKYAEMFIATVNSKANIMELEKDLVVLPEEIY